jgi:hypothetical protein
LLVLSACGGNGSGPNTNSGSGGAPGSGGSASGGATSSGGATGSGGRTGSGGVAASGGTTSSGGAAASGGQTGSGGVTGAGGDTSPPAGGRSGGGGAAGRGGQPGHPDGGAPGAGGAGGKAGSGGAAGCTRDLLKRTVDAYFTALAAHSAATLPLAASVKFTENGKVLTVGQDGMWKTAGMVKGAHSALDVTTCSAASEAVVPDGAMDLPYALRLKLVDQQLTEIETIAVHPGDYKVSGSSFASDPAAILMSDTTVHWEQAVPTAQQNSYAELTSWMDKYFKVFPAGVCNTASSCKRLENGGGSFSCSAGASCQMGMPTGTPVLKSHAIFADADTGIGVGFDNFMGNCDMHIFKMYGGMVYQVDAVLGACSSTGWDN